MKLRGFTVADIANDPLHRTIKTTVEVRYGPKGKAGAELVASEVAGAKLVADKRADASVDLVLGPTYTALIDTPSSGSTPPPRARRPARARASRPQRRRPRPRPPRSDRGPPPHRASQPPAVCADCGFAWGGLPASSFGVALASLQQRYAERLTADAGSLRRRPAPDVWSPLEYACHVRDVLWAQRERVYLAPGRGAAQLRPDEPGRAGRARAVRRGVARPARGRPRPGLPADGDRAGPAGRRRTGPGCCSTTTRARRSTTWPGWAGTQSTSASTTWSTSTAGSRLTADG